MLLFREVEDDELIAADTEALTVAERRLDHIGKTADVGIASIVSQRVVDVFQSVQVGKHHAHITWLMLVVKGADQRLEREEVQHPRQRVVAADVLQHLVALHLTLTCQVQLIFKYESLDSVRIDHDAYHERHDAEYHDIDDVIVLYVARLIHQAERYEQCIGREDQQEDVDGR